MFGLPLRCRVGLSALVVLTSQLVANAAPESDFGLGRAHPTGQVAQRWELAQAEDDHAAHHPAASGSARPAPYAGGGERGCDRGG